MRLAPELVPRPLWNLSASRLLKGPWQREIRPAVREEFNDRCSHCEGQTERMFAHEQWSYDETNGIATLVGIEFVCQDCNSCLHIGRLPAQYVKHALSHLATVNGITVKDAMDVVSAAGTEWARRSTVAWSIAVDPALIERFPALAELPQRAASAPASARSKS